MVGADALDATMTGADIVTAINGQGQKSLVNIDVGVLAIPKTDLCQKDQAQPNILEVDGTWQTPPDTKTTVAR